MGRARRQRQAEHDAANDKKIRDFWARVDEKREQQDDERPTDDNA